MYLYSIANLVGSFEKRIFLKKKKNDEFVFFKKVS